ncbi:MAG: ATP-binding cassette domain-containing protein [Oligoflexia bacterium]|nr:ATP-binding cassette domain-containing protein [Oligoflexia bacterium]
MTETLFVRGLRKPIADWVLTADFEVGPGERAAILGRSGIGKTTLLRIIAGLEPPGAGSIWLGKEDITNLPAERRRIGFVFQDQALFPTMNVLENVVFGLRMAGVPRAEREKTGLEWLERVRLSKHARARVATLSGGEAQRVAFARAWVMRPRVLLLDEPFSSLDEEIRGELRQILREAHAAWPVPMLMVSHDAKDIDELVTVPLRFQEEQGGSMRSVFRFLGESRRS